MDAKDLVEEISPVEEKADENGGEWRERNRNPNGGFGVLMSRRTFNKVATFVGGVLVGGGRQRAKAQEDGRDESREGEPQKKAEIVIVDIVDSPEYDVRKIAELYPEGTFLDFEELAANAMSENQLVGNKELFSLIFSQLSEFERKYQNHPDKLEAVYRTFFTVAFLNQKAGHGKLVAESVGRMKEMLGMERSEVVIYPLQKALVQTEMTVGEVEGLPTMGINLGADGLIWHLEEASGGVTSPHRVFNLSFPVGETNLVLNRSVDDAQREVARGWNSPFDPNKFYVFPRRNPDGSLFSPNEWREVMRDGGPVMVWERMYNDGPEQVIEPQAKEKAEIEYERIQAEIEAELRQYGESLLPAGLVTLESYDPQVVNESIVEVNRLAKAFPDDILVMAGGNRMTDLRGQEWEENVIMVGEWKGGEIKSAGSAGRNFGLDIYVPNDDFELAGGSSLSNALISNLAKKLLDEGVEVREIKRTIQERYCRREQYVARIPGDSEMEVKNAWVIDRAKIAEEFEKFRG